MESKVIGKAKVTIELIEESVEGKVMGNVNDFIPADGGVEREREDVCIISVLIACMLCTAVFISVFPPPVPLNLGLFFGLGFPSYIFICIEILPKLFNFVILVELNYTVRIYV